PEEPSPTPQLPTREVDVLVVGSESISDTIIGRVINHDAITLVAQSAGPVKKISVYTGQKVQQGDLILTQTTAYNSGNAATVQRQIAAKSAQLAQETLTSTVESVSQARELADLN